MRVHKKVLFQNEMYWLHQLLDGFANYNLSPLHHYNEHGELNVAATADEIAFAVITGEDIIRYGKVIGKMSDLVEITDGVKFN